ncbi:MAG: peptidylprolyl isomerase [Candidatus Micrarchaeota archaeon]
MEVVPELFSGDYLALNKGDFIKIEYDAYDDDGRLFDSTSGDIAKSLHGKEGAMLVVFGFDKLLSGLEDALHGMKKGEKIELDIPADKAFGQRNKNLLRIMSRSDFIRNEINPVPGLTVHVDTEQGRQYGIIKSSSGGRVLVDFNHPLAGRNVKYSLTLVDVVTDTKSKTEEILKDIKLEGEVNLDKDVLSITLKPTEHFDSAKKTLELVIKNVMPDVKTINVSAK